MNIKGIIRRIAIMVVLSVLVSVTVYAQTFEYAYNGTTLTYQIVSVPDHEAAVVNAPAKCVNVSVPSVVYCNGEAFKVTEICGCKYGNGAFKDCKYLKTVSIPNTVYRIGSDAFNGCSWLRSVNLPSNVVQIEERAFYGCENLTSITLPQSLVYVGDNAFDGTRLTSVTLPASLGKIGGGAFDSDRLTKVKMPRELGFVDGRNIVFTDPYVEFRYNGSSGWNNSFPSGFTVWSPETFRRLIMDSPSTAISIMKNAKINDDEQEQLIVQVLLDSGYWQEALRMYPNNETALLYKRYVQASAYFGSAQKFMEAGAFEDAKNNYETALQFFPDDEDLKHCVQMANDSIVAKQQREAEAERLREKQRKEAEERARHEAEQQKVRTEVDYADWSARTRLNNGELQNAVEKLQAAIDTADAHNYAYRKAELKARIDSIKCIQKLLLDPVKEVDYAQNFPLKYKSTEDVISQRLRKFLLAWDVTMERNVVSLTLYSGNKAGEYKLEESARALKKFCNTELITLRLQPVTIDDKQVKGKADYNIPIEYIRGTVKVSRQSRENEISNNLNMSPQLRKDMERTLSFRLNDLPYSCDGKYKFAVTSMDVNGRMEHTFSLKSSRFNNGPQNAWRSLLFPFWGDKYVGGGFLGSSFDNIWWYGPMLCYSAIGYGAYMLSKVNQSGSSSNSDVKTYYFAMIGFGATLWIGDVLYVWIKGAENKKDNKKEFSRFSFTYDPVHDAPELVYSINF